MEEDAAPFFGRMPEALPLYKAIEGAIRGKYPGARIRVQKTQISFSDRRGFAYVWLPVRRMKSRPPVYLILSFGLPFRIDSPRIAEASEPCPDRWTHHVIIASLKDIDEEVLGWIDLSYRFSLRD